MTDMYVKAKELIVRRIETKLSSGEGVSAETLALMAKAIAHLESNDIAIAEYINNSNNSVNKETL